jgi:hypothetical protein
MYLGVLEMTPKDAILAKPLLLSHIFIDLFSDISYLVGYHSGLD